MHGNRSTAPRPALNAQWQRLGIHRASEMADTKAWSTGLAALDAHLPGGGYPLGAVTELLLERPGIGELSLLLRALGARLAAHPDNRLACVEPPYRLNAPALDRAGIDRRRMPVICCRDKSERVWSVEQLASAGGFVAFVLWEDTLKLSDLRRLQLAGEKAGCPVFVFRSLARAADRSPAALRLAVRCHNGRQRITIVKCRGPAGASVAGLSVGRDNPWRVAAEKRGPACRLPIQTAANQPIEYAASGNAAGPERNRMQPPCDLMSPRAENR